MKFYRESRVASLLFMGITLFVNSCIEDSFSTNIDDLPLELKDSSTVDIELIPYQSPPDIGSHRYLYLGNKNGFKIDRTLLKLGSLTALRDSSFHIVDSKIKLTLVDSVLEYQPSFLISYVAMDSTMEFSESGTNFSNDDWLDDIVFDEQLTSSLTQDTSGTYAIEFSVDTSVVLVWADTSETSRLLMLETQGLSGELIQFYATENGSFAPALIVSYSDSVTVTVDSIDTLILDTLELVLEMSADVSIVEPPLFTEGAFDSTLLYFSNGAGMKALMNVDLSALNVPEEAVILRANLVLHNDSLNSQWITDGIFKMKIATLIDSITNVEDYDWPAFISEDSLGTGTLKVSMLDSASLQITHRIDRLVEPIFLGTQENLGFKLETSATPSIFNFVTFYTSLYPDPSLHPRLEIYYGIP